MEQYVVEQIKYGLKYLPKFLAKSYFEKLSSGETRNFRAKTGGFIKGVCHPNNNYEQIKGAGLEWIRCDIPFPFMDDLISINPSYTSFKQRMNEFVANGLKVMAVTPYPKTFIEHGIDPRTDEEGVRKVARFIIEDMRDTAAGFQITNEMGVPRFILPLNMDEAARFIGIQAEEMFPLRGSSVIGYNSAGPQADLHEKMMPYMQFIDYVGVDIYIGCFANMGGAIWMYDAILRYLWSMTKKPILLQEFGYISLGEPKTPEEKRAILEKYGFSGEEDVKKDAVRFVDNLPPKFSEHIKEICKDESHYYDLVFKSDMVNHVYCELPEKTVMKGYPHTHQGQAKFITDVFERFKKLPFLCGAFLYCYSDGEACYICSQEDCPTETKWGIVTLDGTEKPSYFALAKALKKM